MSKFSIFSIFRHKACNFTNEFKMMEEKIKAIKIKYNKETKPYIDFAEQSLTNSKKLYDKLVNVQNQRDNYRHQYESFIRAYNLTEAKVIFIKYKSYANAYENLKKIQIETDKKLSEIKNNLETIRLNDAMIEAKLVELQTEADAVQYLSMINIQFDYNKLITDLEAEIKTNRWKVEAKTEINNILQVDNLFESQLNKNIDFEFDEAVKEINESFNEF